MSYDIISYSIFQNAPHIRNISDGIINLSKKIKNGIINCNHEENDINAKNLVVYFFFLLIVKNTYILNMLYPSSNPPPLLLPQAFSTRKGINLSKWCG